MNKDDRIKELDSLNNFLMGQNKALSEQVFKECLSRDKRIRELERQRTIEQGAWEQTDAYKEGNANLRIKLAEARVEIFRLSKNGQFKLEYVPEAKTIRMRTLQGWWWHEKEVSVLLEKAKSVLEPFAKLSGNYQFSPTVGEIDRAKQLRQELEGK